MRLGGARKVRSLAFAPVKSSQLPVGLLEYSISRRFITEICAIEPYVVLLLCDFRLQARSSSCFDERSDRQKAKVSLRSRVQIKLQFLHMAGYDDEKDNSWIEKVRSGGAVPYLEPENCSNGWATPTSDNFMVRGPNYLSDKIKIRGGEYLLEPLGFDWIKGPSKISEVLRNENHRVRRAIDDQIASGNRPFVWAFNLQLPTNDNYSAVMYFVALEPIQDGTLMDKFLKGDDSFRNSRLKLIANIVQGPWIVRTAVGEQAVCILGRALSCKYASGLNFIEVDVDVGSSIIANAIVHLAFGYITTLTVDLAFLIEGQTEEELPEQILGAVRFSNLNPVSACLCDLTSDGDAGSLPPLLPTRLWRSIGFGFTSLSPQGSLEPSSFRSDHANGNLHGEDDAKKDENCC